MADTIGIRSAVDNTGTSVIADLDSATFPASRYGAILYNPHATITIWLATQSGFGAPLLPKSFVVMDNLVHGKIVGTADAAGPVNVGVTAWEQAY